MSLNRFGGLITGTFNPLTDQKTATVEYLVVAGGGGGGNRGGGGGAGGLLTAAGFAVAAGSALTVTVGAGGSGTPAATSTTSTSGTNSVFSSITATGGGAGGQNTTSDAGLNGGLQKNSLRSLSNENPFITNTLNYKNSNTKFNVFGLSPYTLLVDI